MKNNDYAFSLRLYVILNGIKRLFELCPLSRSRLNRYIDEVYEPAARRITTKALLPISSRNIPVDSEDLRVLKSTAEEMLEQIDAELLTEKQKNVRASIEVIKEEVGRLIKLLS